MFALATLAFPGGEGGAKRRMRGSDGGKLFAQNETTR